MIVGAGPGGALAALRLAEAGARVLICEKARLPRPKACGGALTPQPVSALLGWDLAPLIEAQASASLFQYGTDPGIERPQDYGAWLVDRAAFDWHFAERAVGAGAQLRDGCEVRAVHEHVEKVELVLKSGERLSARFLIGADGAMGRTAAALGLARKAAPALAIDAELVVRDDLRAAEGSRMRFSFGGIGCGYAWVFPKRDVLSCGIALWGQPRGLPARLDDYLARLFPDGGILSQARRGHPIPVYEGRARLATRRCCLVGDAAGLVDPVLGEGIRYALESGTLAAQAVCAAMDGDGDLTAYSEDAYEAIGRPLDALRRFVMPILLDRPRAFYDQFFVKDRSYSTLAQSLAQRTAHALPGAAG